MQDSRSRKKKDCGVGRLEASQSTRGWPEEKGEMKWQRRDTRVFVSFHEEDRKYRKLFADHMGADVVDKSVGDGDT